MTTMLDAEDEGTEAEGSISFIVIGLYQGSFVGLFDARARSFLILPVQGVYSE